MTSGDLERTRLANERTYLAWWRTGIAALAVPLALGWAWLGWGLGRRAGQATECPQDHRG